MEKERIRIVDWMDRRKLDNILEDWQDWWQNVWTWSGRQESEKAEKHSCSMRLVNRMNACQKAGNNLGQAEGKAKEKEEFRKHGQPVRLERAALRGKRPYSNNLIGFSAFWVRLEKERKKDEKSEKDRKNEVLKMTKATNEKTKKLKNVRFWQGFLETKTHPSDHPGQEQVHTLLPRPKAVTTGMHDIVNQGMKSEKLPQMGVLGVALKLEHPTCTLLSSGGDSSQVVQVSTHLDPVETMENEGGLSSD